MNLQHSTCNEFEESLVNSEKENLLKFWGQKYLDMYTKDGGCKVFISDLWQKNGRSVIFAGGGLVSESNRAGTFMELGGDGAP